MSSMLENKKEKKKQSLINSAYDLFMDKGINKTTIDDIASNANVGKGTFYLYFKDKTDIMQEIVYKISRKILLYAHKQVKKNPSGDFLKDVISLIDYIIEYFKNNILVLKLIEKNFSWPLIKEKLNNSDSDKEMDTLLELCISNSYMSMYTKDEAFKIIFMIIEMCGSICFSSIINKQPDTIDNMKPTLYMMITKILSK